MGWFWQHIVTASALKGKVWGKKVVIFTLVLFLSNAVMLSYERKMLKFRISVRFVALQLSPISASHGFELTAQSGQLRPQSFCYKMRFPNKYSISGKKAIGQPFEKRNLWNRNIERSTFHRATSLMIWTNWVKCVFFASSYLNQNNPDLSLQF